jgi:hypothetical protein
MNFGLAEKLFFFVVRSGKALIEYFNRNDLVGQKESDILLERSARIASLIEAIYKDGVISLSDLPEIVSILQQATVFIGFDFEAAAVQIANASKQELEEAYKRFDDEFVLNDKNKEANLEIIFHEIFNLINSANRIIKICGKIK